MRESIAFSDCNQQKSNMHQHHLLSGSTTMHLNSCHACMHDCDQKQLCNRSCDCQESVRDSPCFWKNWMKFEILPTNEKDEDRISASENTNEKRNFTYFSSPSKQHGESSDFRRRCHDSKIVFVPLSLSECLQDIWCMPCLFTVLSLLYFFIFASFRNCAII